MGRPNNQKEHKSQVVPGPWLLIAAAAACAAPPAGRQMVTAPVAIAPGVSLELARHRAATLSDVRYAIDLDVRAADRAEGTVTVTLSRAADAGDLVLDFRGKALGDVVVNGTRVADARWADDHIVIPAARLSAGANTVEVAFTAPIAAAGAAIISYDDTPDNARYLYTLLVPSDAQLLFPVFDQPDIKARFTWSVLAPRDWTVLANGPLVLRDEHAAPDAARWTFAETQPISTYVAAFAAGPYTVLGGAGAAATASATGAAGTPHSDVARDMRLLVRRSRAAEVDTTELLRLNQQGLRWLERYFDSAYPFSKLDLLLAPAFPFGGMEHAGAIFYNESTFIFREPPTLTRRLGRAGTIYHEVAHQWFGDLVTMRWFDDLWLKEGFATFMAAKMQQDLHPESNAWKTFYLRNKPAAYAVDVTAGTTPVWQELPNLDLAKSNYGAIVYNKAPSVLKQLEFLAGDDAFRRGLQLFLKRHAYANATWRDLLASITEASGVDLREFGEHYILRAGLPLVETELALGDDGRIQSLALVQRPVRDLPGDRGGSWPGRVRVRLGYAERDDVVLDVTFAGERTAVPSARGLPAPAFVFPNDGDYGYGIFLPDQRSADWLTRSAHGLKDDLLRALAWGALWDLVREARLAPDRYVGAALQALDTERDEQIAGTLLGRIGYAIERFIPDGATRDRLAAALETRLLARVADPALDYGLRRSSLDALLAGARSPAARTALQQYLSGARDFDGKPLGQPSRWSAVTRLLALDDPSARALLAAEQARDSTPEAPRMRFVAGAAMPTAENKAAYFARYFDDASLNEEWVTASLGAFNHELHAALTLPYLRRALGSSTWLRDNRRIFFLPRWLDAFIGGHASAEALQIVDAFLAAETDLPQDIRRRVLQSRDELERAVRIRARFAAGR
jgi:aminopeptidase N